VLDHLFCWYWVRCVVGFGWVVRVDGSIHNTHDG
jgi:hypothetical protein